MSYFAGMDPKASHDDWPPRMLRPTDGRSRRGAELLAHSSDHRRQRGSASASQQCALERGKAIVGATA
eukprot:10133115-Alexandrium_andersonii.AAC.1